MTRAFAPILILLMALLVAAPIIAIGLHWLNPDFSQLSHLWQTQIPELIVNTLLLALVVGVLASVFGVSSAVLVTLFAFRGRAIFEWLLVLPLAVPAYVLAFVYLGILDYSGPVQQGLATLFNTQSPIFLMDGVLPVALIFSLAFYPYVYLSVRAAMQHQGWQQIEAARSLGTSKFQALIKVLLPGLRGPWVAGLALVLMEVMADFGTVAIFNFDTFTTAIYKAWFGLYSLQAAAQLATMLLAVVALIVIIERYQRSASGSSKLVKLTRKPLNARWQFTVIVWLSIIVAIALLIPITVLSYWWLTSSMSVPNFSMLVANTIKVGALAAFVLVGYNLMVALASGRVQSWRIAKRLTQLGYALPGSVLAVGVMLCFAYVDQAKIFSFALLGSLTALIVAYVVRFNAVAATAIDSTLERIPTHLHEAAQSLGATKVQRAMRITMPLLMPGVLTASLMVLVDVMKEMPATLLLRPFGYDTLAVRIYEYTSEGEWQLAAAPSLVLLLVGLLPTLLLIRHSNRA